MSSIKEMLNEFVELQILYLVPDLEKREVFVVRNNVARAYDNEAEDMVHSFFG